jgi:creatinine amidohydrolase
VSTPAAWEQLTREELARRALDSVLLLPVGATEQHGPHLGAGTDTLLCTAVAEAAAAAAKRPVVLAPTLAFGASEHHLPFGATLSLSPETLGAVLRDVLGSAASAGFRRALVLNGHGGNAETCRAAAAAAAGLLAEARSYWEGVELDAPEPVPGHAGLFETAMVLAVAPAAARPELARESPGAGPWGRGPASPERWREIDGFTDDPRGAQAEDGRRWLAACASAAAAVIDRLGGADA